MIRNDLYEKWIEEWAEECHSDIPKYKNKVKNFSMSPQCLELYWQNKDDNKEPFKGKRVSPTIRNSYGNRPPNHRHKSTRIDKIIYLLANIAYVRDYNFLPASMIINEKTKKRFKTLLAKDRGTFNFYFTKKDDKLEVSFWRDLLKKLEDEEYASDEKMKMIIDRMKELISLGSSFSMRESVPNDLWESWYYDEDYVVLRVKFETYESHKNEMKRINNTTNPWVEHNHIMADKITPLPIEYPNTYKVETIDGIYSEVIEHPLFQGDSFLNVPHQKVEEFESFIPWLFTSLDFQYKNDTKYMDEILSILARASDSNLKKKAKAYENTFKSNCKVKPKTKTAEFELFKDKIDFLVTISKNNQIDKFLEKVTKISNKIFKGKPKTKWHKNITDLRISKWDSFLTMAHCISWLSREVHGQRAFTKERVIDITSLFLKEAIKMLDESSVRDELMSHNGGLVARHDYFWKKVTDAVVEIKIEQLNGNFDFSLLEEIVRDSVSQRFATNDTTEIYDRASGTEVDIYKPFCADNNVGEQGHLIPTEELFYGNCVVQPPKDNVYNDNHPIRDIDAYIKQYLDDVKRIMGDDLDFIIFETTKLYLYSWKDQKNYKII